MPTTRVLIGRDEELALAQSVLRSPRGGGLLVHGPTGVGKTAFAHRVVADLGAEVRWVQADRVLARYPYGALAPLLDPQSPPPPGSEPALIRRAVVQSLNSAGPEPSAVVVDDADELDVPSSTVLSQLVMAGRIRLVVLSRQHPAVSTQFETLVHDGMLTALEMVPLGPDDIRDLLLERLGGHIPSTLEDYFIHRCDGNPRILDSWLTAAREQAVVRGSNGVWLLTGRQLQSSPMVRDTGRQFLAAMDARTRTAADLIALAGGLQVADAVDAGLGDEVDLLIRSGLCRVDERGAPSVHFTSRASADLHRATIPQGRSVVLRTGIGRKLTPSEGGLHERMNWIIWSLTCRIDLDPELLGTTAREALRYGEPLLAHTMLSSVACEDLSAPYQLNLVTALCDVNRALLASDILLQALPQLTTTADVDRSALLWARIVLRLDTPAEEFGDAVQKWRTRIGGAGPSPDLISRRDQLADLLTEVLSPPGGRLTDLSHYETLTAGDDNGAVKALAMVVLSGHHAHRAHRAVAQDLAQQAAAIGATFDSAADIYRLLRRAHPGLSTSLPSPFPPSAEPRCADPAHLAQETGPGEFERGFRESRRGHYAQAAHHLRIAAEALTVWDDRQLLPLALASAAFAAAQVPDIPTTDSFLTRLRSVDAQGTPEMQVMTRATELAARRQRGDAQADAQQLLECTQQAREMGSLAVEAEIHLQALTTGLTSTITAMPCPTTLDPRVSDGRVLLAVRIGAALRSEDSSELTELANTVRGCPPLLRTLAEEARQRARRDGSSQKAAQATDLLRAADPQVRMGLSRREREVAEAILEGLSNAEIADKLGVSTRTVEGHVYRLYRRLGIGRRTELTTEHLDPVGAPATSV